MKQLSLFFHFLVASFVGIKAQSSASKNIRQPQHHSDATQLAGRLATTLGTSATIPTENIKDIENALWAVANSDLPQARIVTEHYQVHAFPSNNLYTIHIYTNSDAKWVKELLDGRKVSNVNLSKIMQDNKLAVQVLSNEDGAASLLFSSETPMNTRFVANQLSILDNVLFAEIPMSTKEDGNDITIKSVQGGWLITYSLRFDNCKVGCEHEHSWVFGVNSEKEVVFVSEFGDTPPYYQDAAFQSGLAGER